MNIEKAISSLRKNGYTVTLFDSIDEASAHLNGVLDKKTIGFGDSHTLFCMNLFESLSTHNTVIDPMHPIDGKSFTETASECMNTEVFLTSVNAFSETGELVNIDGTGNRIAGSLFGHKKVYFIVGANKLAATLEEAIFRARNVAAPKNAMRLGLKTPCALKGERCYNCSSPDRICNGMMIYYKKMHDIDMEIIIINNELGF